MPDRKEVKARKTPNFQENGVTQANVEVLRIGGMALVGVKPELSASVGASIRAVPHSLRLYYALCTAGAR